MMTEQVFWFFASVAVVSALLVVVMRNPIASAFWLVSTMLSLAAIFFCSRRSSSARSRSWCMPAPSWCCSSS
jgi:NADH:ubiquinone oxidoreductase subunit 6 (subunit J)